MSRRMFVLLSSAASFGALTLLPTIAANGYMG